MKITTEMTEAAYAASKSVYHKEISKKDAIKRLKRAHGMNEGSASDYIVNFQKIMQGEVYKRTHNKEATDYILTEILCDYGYDQLEKALQAVKEHVEYYKSFRNGELSSIGNIVSRHRKILDAKNKLYTKPEVKVMKTKLTGVIEKEDDLYVALCPEVDVVSQGHTIDEARKNLIEALELFFECASENEIKRRLRKETYIPPVEEMQSRLAKEYKIEDHKLDEMYVTPIEVAYG